MDRGKETKKIVFLGLGVNVVLTLLKYGAGFFGRSSAMIADATHSLSDLFTDVIVFFGLSAAQKPADSCHPYGHGKIEALLALTVGVVLVGVGGGIFWSGAERMLAFLQGAVGRTPGIITLWAGLISVVSKELLYRYTLARGRRLDSSILVAKAWDHRSDALSSVGTLFGISGAIFLGEKWRILDPLAAVVVSVFVLRAAYMILKDSLNELIEGSLPPSVEERVKKVLLARDGVKSFHKLKTRRIGSSIAVDVHIHMRGEMTLSEAHEISRRVEEDLWRTFGEDTHISLHMEPLPKGKKV
ncbi:MAG: cation transporter [Synergistaceae bacterium]|nr:cation transporter [Synergistaceae bacterium]